MKLNFLKKVFIESLSLVEAGIIHDLSSMKQSLFVAPAASDS